MKLLVHVGARPLEIELSRNGEMCHFAVGGPKGDAIPRSASLREVEPGVYSVLLDGRSYEVRIEPGAGHSIASVQGHRFSVEVEDPRRSRRKTSGIAGEGRASVVAPMPGRVVRVLVVQGDTVEAGQGIAVVEAMKMQNEMKAPKTGRVVSVRVKEGDTVAAAETLAEVE